MGLKKNYSFAREQGIQKWSEVSSLRSVAEHFCKQERPWALRSVLYRAYKRTQSTKIQMQDKVAMIALERVQCIPALDFFFWQNSITRYLKLFC